MKKRFRKTHIKQALERRDAKRLRNVLDGTLHDEDKEDELISLIRHTGCLIDSNDGYRKEGWQKELTEVLADVLSGRALTNFFSLIDEASIITLIFRLTKDAAKKLDVSALPPARQAWAVVVWASSQVELIQKQSLKPPEQLPLLVRAGAITLDSEDGRTFHPDSLIAGTEQFLRKTLCMLAYENGWWHQPDKLVIPREALPLRLDVDIAGSHIRLASIWDLVHGASETLRFWGNSVGITSETTGDLPKQKHHRVTFDLNLDTHVYFKVARSRVMQIEFETHISSLELPELDYGEINTQLIPLPPNGFISYEEVFTHAMLAMLYHFDLGQGTKVNGLNPAVLTRGYSVLKRCYDQKFDEAALSAIEIDLPRLVQALRNGSLSDAEIHSFLATVTFGRNSKDFFDCPVISSDEGKVFLLRSFSQFASLPRVVVSRITSLKGKFENKGSRFELEVIDEFVSNGVPAKGFTFLVDSEEFQFDCVVLWEDYVFVLECKNYLLPSESAAQEFHFMEAMNEATQQVQRLTLALRESREKLADHFKAIPEGLIFVPVVLNAMPFSINGTLNGVYLYDYSALSRFLDGKISLNQPLRTEEGWSRVEHVIKRLWEGTSPRPVDLLCQMASPIQLASAFSSWQKQDVTVEFSERLSMVVPILQTKAISSKEMLGAFDMSDEQPTSSTN